MKEQLQGLRNRIKKVTSEAQKLRSDLKELLLALPDNPDINRVTKDPNAFTINSKDLFASDNWSARYHDFKVQYQELVSFLDRLPVDADILSQFEKILEQGWIPGSYRKRIKLHPVVVRNVADLLEIQLTAKG